MQTYAIVVDYYIPFSFEIQAECCCKFIDKIVRFAYKFDVWRLRATAKQIRCWDREQRAHVAPTHANVNDNFKSYEAPHDFMENCEICMQDLERISQRKRDNLSIKKNE